MLNIFKSKGQAAADIEAALAGLRQEQKQKRDELEQLRGQLKDAAINGTYDSVKQQVRKLEDSVEQLGFQIEAAHDLYATKAEEEYQATAKAAIAKAEKCRDFVAEQLDREYEKAAKTLIRLSLLCEASERMNTEAKAIAAKAAVPCEIAPAEQVVSGGGAWSQFIHKLVIPGIRSTAYFWPQAQGNPQTREMVAGLRQEVQAQLVKQGFIEAPAMTGDEQKAA